MIRSDSQCQVSHSNTRECWNVRPDTDLPCSLSAVNVISFLADCVDIRFGSGYLVMSHGTPGLRCNEWLCQFEFPIQMKAQALKVWKKGPGADSVTLQRIENAGSALFGHSKLGQVRFYLWIYFKWNELLSPAGIPMQGKPPVLRDDSWIVQPRLKYSGFRMSEGVFVVNVLLEKAVSLKRVNVDIPRFPIRTSKPKCCKRIARPVEQSCLQAEVLSEHEKFQRAGI